MQVKIVCETAALQWEILSAMCEQAAVDAGASDQVLRRIDLVRRTNPYGPATRGDKINFEVTTQTVPFEQVLKRFAHTTVFACDSDELTPMLGALGKALIQAFEVTDRGGVGR